MSTSFVTITATHRPVRTTLAALLLTTTALAATAPTLSAQAQEGSGVQDAQHAYDIPAQPLAEALIAFGRQSGMQVTAEAALTDGVKSSAVSGVMPWRQALAALLSGTGLSYTKNGSMISLHGAAADGTIRLAPIRVEGVTEGTGSYTTTASNTASRFTMSLKDTPQSVTVVTRQRIDDQGTDEIGEVLEQTVGVTLKKGGPLGSDANPIYSRGFIMNNYQVDGIPRSTRFGFRNDVADLALFDRVEVVRGATGLLNGVGEPSGTVNLTRKRPTGDIAAYLVGEYGSWDHFRVEGDMGGPLTETGNIRARLVGAYEDGGSFVDRLNPRKKVLYGVVEADLGPGTLLAAGVEYQHLNADNGSRFGVPVFFADNTLTNFSRSANMASNQSHQTRRSVSIFSSVEHFFENGWHLKLDVEHARRSYDMVMVNASVSSDVFDPSDGSGFELGSRRWSGSPRQTSAAFHAVGPYSLFGREHELVIGGNYAVLTERGESHNSERVVLDGFYDFIKTGDAPELDVSPTGATSKNHDWESGVYLATRLNVTDRVHLIGGARLSNWKTRTDRTDAVGVETRGPVSKVKGNFSPYAGVTVDITGYMSAYASYTDIFLPATRYDVNGELLAPAEGVNVEGGLKFSFFDDKLNASATIYKTKKDNNPTYVPGPGGAVNYGPTGQYVYEGINGTKTTGFELEISGELSPGWQVSGGYARALPKNPDGTQRYQDVPTDTFKLFTTYRFADGVLEGLTMGGNFRWQNATVDIYSGLEQDGFTVIDLMARYEIMANVAATLNIDNVFDQVYYSGLGSDAWYGEPRRATLTLRVSY